MAIVRKTALDVPSTPQATSVLNGLEAVRAKAKAHGLYYFPLPIEKIIAQYGIRVIYDSEMEISGYIEYAPPNQWTIGVNQYHSPRRQRFTLAHELGHYILHRSHVMSVGKLIDNILLRDGDSTDKEIQANHFAGQLLVPTANLLDAVNKGKRSVADLAEAFEASIAAIRYRAHQEGMLRRV